HFLSYIDLTPTTTYTRSLHDALPISFAYLEKNNLLLTNDGKENIVDDYCALVAATELYKATHKDVYKAAADKRAKSLMNRWRPRDRKSTRLNSSHVAISYAVFCLKKK